MRQTFQQRGGARVGADAWNGWNATWPFASLEATHFQIQVSVAGAPVRLLRADIASVQHYRGIFSQGVRIIHSSSQAPPFVVFWSHRWRQVGAALMELGYPVDF